MNGLQHFDWIFESNAVWSCTHNAEFGAGSSVGRAPQWHCGGREFEPRSVHQIWFVDVWRVLRQTTRRIRPKALFGQIRRALWRKFPSGPPSAHDLLGAKK